MRVTATEAETQRAILEVLALHSIYAGRLNTGAGFVNGRPVQHHTFGKGCADILAFPCGAFGREWYGIVPTWIEVKAPGRKASPEQIQFQRHVESLGHKYLLINSVDQIVAWVETLKKR